ncbi:fungal-specific transcription factor domain-containing protein [Nemania sp. FL0031]|nr:fungal-specific transcription factor domain-containing protein [Nemania sp. FL0031]
MFYTFTSGSPSGGAASQRNAKRYKVTRACDYCRKHRVRCDTETPCSRCVANNVECVFSPPAGRTIESRTESSPALETPCRGRAGSIATTVITTATHAASSAGTVGSVGGTSSSASADAGGSSAGASSVLTPSTPASSAPTMSGIATPISRLEGMESTVGFMSRISAFCSSISHLSPNFPDESPPSYGSLSRPLAFNIAREGEPPAELSKSQVLQLLDMYWQRWHALAPILSRPHIEALYPTLWSPAGLEQRGAPLVDGILALSLLRLHSAGLNRRLLGLHSERGDCSLAYFRRCYASTSQFDAFAQPSLGHVQCYILMALYMLDVGEYQGAYNMIGLAMRAGHTLNLHHGLPETDPDTPLARRVWWTVVHLDFRCARLLGRPVGVQLADVNCPLPPVDQFIYHGQFVRLTWTALTVIDACSRRPLRPGTDHIADVESRAALLTAKLVQLREWRDQELRPLIRRPLHVDHKRAPDWIHVVTDTSPSKLFHGVLLELQYYEEIIGLHRPFICFPSGSLVPQRSPQADAHATTALNHAMATIDLVHRVMSATDMLYGCSEVYQWQWNALLTLVGFLMAYPLCDYAPNARRHVQLALDIFSAADRRNTVAAKAAALTRSLTLKVDSLVKILKPDTQGALSPDATKIRNTEWHDMNVTMDPSQLNSDALWSWTGWTNPDVWSAYSDGITGVLADFPSLPFGSDSFFTMP